MDELSTDVIHQRYEIVAYVEVRDGNPNGDPDSGNAPRMDVTTGHGFMTDVSVKRVIRDYVADACGAEVGYGIFVSDGAVLETIQQAAFTETGHKSSTDAGEVEVVEETAAAGEKGKGKQGRKGAVRAKGEPEADVRRWLSGQFFDVRAFGAVFAGKNFAAGSINGPIQVSFSRSVDPIVPEEVAITRCAVSSAADAAKERTIGRKHIIPYALYRVEVRVSPHRAMGQRGTGFSKTDLVVLQRAILDGFEHRRTASKGHMATRAMVMFEHESALGNAPAFELLERVTAERKVDTPRSYADYEVRVNDAELPSGVTLHQLR